MGLRVELEGEGAVGGVVHPFAGAVVDVDEPQLALRPFQAGLVHGVAVVLAGDYHGAGLQVQGGLVGPPVAELQLLGLCPGGQGHDLVAQADAEHGQLAKELLDLLDAEGVVRRVPGPLESITPSCPAARMSSAVVL